MEDRQKTHKRSLVRERFAEIACLISDWTGSFWAFAAAFVVIAVWLVSGPIFKFSDTWQLVINTATTVVTFLMVFIIQHAQNRETRAIQLKLDELVKALRGASNELIGAEDLSEEEAKRLVTRYKELAAQAQERADGTRAKRPRRKVRVARRAEPARSEASADEEDAGRHHAGAARKER